MNLFMWTSASSFSWALLERNQESSPHALAFRLWNGDDKEATCCRK